MSNINEFNLPKIFMWNLVYAQQQVKPLFTNEASDKLKEFYMKMREEQDESNPLPINSK